MTRDEEKSPKLEKLMRYAGELLDDMDNAYDFPFTDDDNDGDRLCLRNRRRVLRVVTLIVIRGLENVSGLRSYDIDYVIAEKFLLGINEYLDSLYVEWDA